MPLIVTPPHQCTAVVGHDDAKQEIKSAYDSGKMHHAWLLTGPEGIGKASLAFLSAHMVLSAGDIHFDRFNPEHATARLIAAESHPDLFVLRRPLDDKTGVQRDMIPVDEARKIGPFLSMTASYGAGRVAIIDEAHTLNRNGQNAILKMIEEPPSGTTLFLTATTVGALLPTIRSRCRVLKMNALPMQQLDVVLMRLGAETPDQHTRSRLLSLSGGSVGMAVRLLQSDVIPLLDELLSLTEAFPTLDLPRLHKLADQISKKADEEAFALLTALFTDTLREAVRDAALGRQNATKCGFIVKLAQTGRLDMALDIWESTRQSFATAQRANLDNKLAFINAVSEISRVLV